MSGAALVARCPAKVNLMLRVLGRRDDGYHDIRTVFQAIDLWDTLEVTRGESLVLTCDGPAVPTDESNLVLRAAALLCEVDPRARRGALLRLRKRIPVGGGLGGGSSDAAGALLALSHLWDLRLSGDDLSRMAARLGADVPFFLLGGTALGEGRGDRLSAIPFAGPSEILLGCPPFGISTEEAYRLLDHRLTPPRDDVSVNCFPVGNLPKGNDFGAGINDFEEVVFGRWPDLGRFRDELLRSGAAVAMLSGSGSSVLGLFDRPGAAGAALGTLEGRFARWRLISTRTIPGGTEVESHGGGG